jgi:elongation factor Ts
MEISMELVKELRARTGAGVLDARKALSESAGDMEKAISWLREKGKASAAKKATRKASEGFIGSYVHSNGKVAVLVSLLCETDFVARNEKFKELARNLALHIAASDPIVVSPEDVPQSDVDNEKAIAIKQAEAAGKPANIAEKMVEGKLKKFREEKALLTQPYVKDPSKQVKDLLHEAVLELGENITVGSFSRLSI